MVGETFDMLTVTAKAEKVGNKRLWLCECTCGTQVKRTKSNLERPSTFPKSCGDWECRHGIPIELKSRRKKLKEHYDLTWKEFVAMFEAQNGKCAICFVDFTDYSVSCVDHCHATGVVRGLLCSNCNSGIGLMSDCTQKLRNAIRYLENS